MCPPLRCRHHLTLKVIYVEAEEGGAQGAALLEANAGLEAWGRAVSSFSPVVALSALIRLYFSFAACLVLLEHYSWPTRL